MNKNMLIAKLQNKNKGQWMICRWTSDLPIKAIYKKQGVVVNKTTTTTVRVGISYQNMKSVQAKAENGYELKHELNWGVWSTDHPGLLIEHKGNIYLRMYNSPNKPKSVYFLNGKEISKEDLISKGIVQDSYWKKTNESVDCFTVNITNIEEIK